MVRNGTRGLYPRPSTRMKAPDILYKEMKMPRDESAMVGEYLAARLYAGSGEWDAGTRNLVAIMTGNGETSTKNLLETASAILSNNNFSADL